MRHALQLRNELVGNVTDVQTRVKTVDQSMTGTTPVAIDELFFYVAPGEVWMILSVMFVTSASSTPDIVWGWNVPTGAIAPMSALSIWSANTVWTVGTFSGLLAANDPAGSMALPWSWCLAGALGGIVQMTFRQANNNATAITIKALSSFIARRIG